MNSLSNAVETSELKQLGPIMRFLVELLFEKISEMKRATFCLSSYAEKHR